MIEANIWVSLVLSVFVILLTEFIINCIVQIRMLSIFPNQKFKTVRKKVVKQRFLKRFALFYLLEYNKSRKTKFCIIVCYFYRVFCLVDCCYLIYLAFKEPIPFLGEALHSFWLFLLVIPGIIWLRRSGNK